MADAARTMPMARHTSRTRLERARSKLVAFAIVFAGLAALNAPAQTLARPGWAGSGMNLEPWWTHAVLYMIDPHGFRASNESGTGDLRSLASQLDYVRSLGVDAITLTHFMPEQGEGAARSQSVDPALGSLDDFDDLVREASRDNLRVIVELDPQQLADPTLLAAAARFWLSRGVAGISLRTQGSTGAASDPQHRAAQLHRLHEVTRSFTGQRILIGESGSGDVSARHGDVDLALDPALAKMTSLTAANVRAALEHLQGAPGISLLSATDLPGLDRSASRFGNDTNGAAGPNDPAIVKALALVLLGTRANAQLYFGQEIGLAGKPTLMPWGVATDLNPNTTKAKKLNPEPTHGPEILAEEADPASVLNWYRRLIDLHHGNATLRAGSSELLNHDDQDTVVWVSRRAAVNQLAPAIVVVCNFSAKPVMLSLASDMLRLHLRGSFLRTVLRSDTAMGPMNLNAVKLPPFGVYIGELRY